VTLVKAGRINLGANGQWIFDTPGRISFGLFLEPGKLNADRSPIDPGGAIIKLGMSQEWAQKNQENEIQHPTACGRRWQDKLSY